MKLASKIEPLARAVLPRGMKLASRLEPLARAVLPQRVVYAIKGYLHQRDVSLFEPYVIKKRVGDDHFDLCIGDSTGQRWYGDHDGAESVEMCALRDLLVEPGDVVLECGSHHGYTTLLLSYWVGEEGKVYAFEPSKQSFDILRRNIEINRRTNIIARHAAVGETNGTIHVSDSSCAHVMGGSYGYAVEVIALDELASVGPDVIKIDVEGFEAAVLKGCPELLKSRPKLFIEVHTDLLPDYDTSVEEIFSLMDAGSYDIWILYPSAPAPVRYKNEAITERVHLLCVPRA
jgi:FkbM family methyltransferase